MKRRILKILYINIKGLIVLVGLYLARKIPFTDNFHYYVQLLVYTGIVFFLLGITHYIFMNLLLSKNYNNK